MKTENKLFKPMLASPVKMELLQYPCIASPKLDGVRCLAMNGQPMSRSMKVIPNRYIQKWFADHADVLDGLDGELIIGQPTASDCYRQTVSGVMREDEEPDFTFYVFDRWDAKSDYAIRLMLVLTHSELERKVILPYETIHNETELNSYEVDVINAGFEGVILRSPRSPYKQGRSSAKEGYLLKVKRFLDAEAVIVGYTEEMYNGNEAQVSEIGRTKRSSHKANKSGKGSLGAWMVKGLTAFEGIEFKIGTGMDAAYREEYWEKRNETIGKIVKFKYFDVGIKDAPRHPVYLGFRNEIDMEK